MQTRYRIIQTLILALFFLCPANPGLTAEIRQKQATDTVAIANGIITLLHADRYIEAEAQLEQLLREKRQDTNGYRVMESVYMHLASLKDPEIYDRWARASPDSHFPFAIRGKFYLERAFSLGGADQTILLTSKQRSFFDFAVTTAKNNLEHAYGLRPDDPSSSSSMTALCIMTRAHPVEMETWFERAVSADPAWISGYRSKLLFLSPRFHGSEQKMYLFAAKCFNNSPPGSIVYTIALEYIRMKAQAFSGTIAGEQFLIKPEIYNLLSQGVDRYRHDFPEAPFIPIYEQLLVRSFINPYEAIAAFSQDLEINPNRKSSRKGLTEAYLASKQYEKALENLHQLLYENPDSDFALSRLGRVHFLYRDDPVAGARYFDRAISKTGSIYAKKKYLYEKALQLQKVGRHTEAADNLSQAIDLDPFFEEAYIARAESFYNTGDLKSAIDDLIVVKSDIKGPLATKARSMINSFLRIKSSAQRPLPAVIPPMPENNASPDDKKEDKARAAFIDGRDVKIREHLLKGVSFFYSGQYSESAEMFFRVISLDEQQAQAYYMLGQIAELAQDSPARAGIYFHRAYSISPFTTDYRSAVIDNFISQGKYGQAITILNQAIGSDPMDARLFYHRALCLRQTGNIDQAISDIKRAISLNPADGKTQQLLQSLRADKTKDTEQNLKPATPHDQIQEDRKLSSQQETDRKEQVEYHISVGIDFLNRGRTQNAEFHLLKAAELSPGNSKPYYLLGKLFGQNSNYYKKSINYFTQAIKLDGSRPDYFFDRGNILFSAEDYSGAREDFSAALALDPLDARSLFFRGNCNLQLGDKEQAIADYRKAASISGDWKEKSRQKLMKIL